MFVRPAILFAMALLLTPYTAIAQWLDFTEESGARLLLETVPDNDTEEKDIAVGDLDRDGWLDIIVVRKAPFSNPGPRQDLLLMNEGGVLVDRTSTYAPGFEVQWTDSRDVLIVDLDGDDWLDVFVVNTFTQEPRFYWNAGLDANQEWLGLIDQSANRLPPMNTSVVQFCAAWAGDVTGNGAPDIYMSNYKMSGGTTDVLLINDGTGHFTNESAARLGNYANVAFGTGAEIYDIDLDGDNDIIKISTLYSAPPFGIGIFILYNDGNGVFNVHPFQEISSSAPYMFTLGLLNGDDMFDMYITQDPNDRITLLTGVNPNGPVTYTQYTLNNAQSPRTAGFGGNTKMADIDHDGDPDVGISPVDVDIQNCGGPFAGEFALLRNDGNGGLTDPYAVDTNIHLRPHDYAFLDINGDGCLDIFMGLCTGWSILIREDCTVTLPDSFTLVRGLLLSGGLEDLYASDDSRIVARPDVLAPNPEPPVQLEVEGTAPADSTNVLMFRFEGHASRDQITQTISLFNYQTQSYEQVDARTASTSDTVVQIEVSENASRFLEPRTGKTKAIIKWKATALSFFADWTVEIDQTTWTIMQ